MSDTTTISPSSPFASSRWRVLLGAALLVVVAFAAYHNSFSGPFIYDDTSSIPDNPTIRHLWPLRDVLLPPRDSGVTVNGRPIVNLSLAVNYALGGTEVFGYHVVNLLIHTLAGLTLFGVVRRTLLRPGLSERFGPMALKTAWLVAAIWLAHPLQTESVTYVIQRAEALVGLFYLLTLYCFIRSVDSPGSSAWSVATIGACLLGMASKEVMVSAPLIVLLYDRTFVSGTFAEAWRRRGPFFAGLAATWILLGVLVASTGSRGGTAGFGAGGMAWWAYAFTQCRAIVIYLGLAVWPRNLVFDYGVAVDKNLLTVAPQALVVCALVGGTLFALRRRPVWGFLGACFLAVLAPSSSFVPIATETIAEHRMYLPLAAVIAGVLPSVIVLAGRWGFLAGLAAVAGLAVQSGHRNDDYAAELPLWRDTARKWPTNPRAHNNIGENLFRHGKAEEAIAQFREAMRLLPSYLDAANNLGNCLTRVGRNDEAIQWLESALKVKPDYAPTLNNLGNAYYQVGRTDEAIGCFERAVKSKPDFSDAHNNLGVALQLRGRDAESIPHYVAALAINPNYTDAHYNYANALAATGKIEEAISHFERALSLKPNFAEAYNNLGLAMFQQNRINDAKKAFERALFIQPNYAQAHNNYGAALFRLGDVANAIEHFKTALQLNPQFADARNNLALAQQPQQ